MKKVLIGLSVLLCSAQALATPQTIKVVCDRGPFQIVMIDEANDIFINSLLDYGCTINEAIAIGTLICRDEDLVVNPSNKNKAYREQMSQKMITAVRQVLKRVNCQAN